MDSSALDGKQLSIYYSTCGSIAGQGLCDALHKMDNISVRRVKDAVECQHICHGPHDLVMIDAPLIESFHCLSGPESCVTTGRSNLVVVDFDVRPDRLIHSLDVGARGYWMYNDPFESFVQGIFRVARGLWSFSPQVRKHIEIREETARYHPASVRTLLGQLTGRQAEVCMLLAAGKTVKETAQRLGIAHSTAEKHKRTAMTRLGVRRAVELVRLMVGQDRDENPAEHGEGADSP